jgi:hypothetical protein
MVDNGLRILSSANQVSASNTPQTCISFCAAQSYALAGVEYGQSNKLYFPDNMTEHALPQVKNAGAAVHTTRWQVPYRLLLSQVGYRSRKRFFHRMNGIMMWLSRRVLFSM